MKALYITMVLILLNHSIWACDFCNLYLGINPNDYEHSITLNYKTRTYGGLMSPNNISTSTQSGLFTNKTSHGGGSHTVSNEPVYIEESYKDFEFQGKFYLNEKIQLITSLSVSNNTFLGNGVISNWATGIGDLLLLGKYQVFNTISTNEDKKFRQRIMLGGGLKLPIGNYRVKDRTGIIDSYVQPGSGA